MARSVVPHFGCNIATSGLQAACRKPLARYLSTHFLTIILSTRMLDEVVSDTDMAPMPSDAPAPKIKAQSADAIFGPVRLKDTEKDISSADTPPLPPDATVPEIKVQPADALLGRVPLKNTEKASTRRVAPFFIRLLRYSARAAVVACLCGLAWSGGVYYSLGHSPFDLLKARRAPEVQQSPQPDDMVSAVRQMAEEMRALKTSVDGRGVAQDTGQKNKLNSVQTTTGATIADLIGRVDKRDAEFTTKLSQLNDQLTSIEQQISASHATLVPRAQTPQKRAKHIHDAFDPSQDPKAPGAPRPLGAW
jgi:hypothetical protein